MPSFLHESLVDLFRQRPALAPELLAACAGIRFSGVTARSGSIDLTQVVPAEYRTDAVTVLHGPTGEVVAAVIAEVQLGIDEDKRRTWPLYVAAARAGFGCPATLLVLAPDPAVARWARHAIELGHPGFALRPIVIGYEQIPRICDEVTARRAPELAVLSVMAHPELETAEAARRGISGLSEEKQKLYWDLIENSLPELVRHAIEVRMIEGYVYQSEFARKYYFQGREEGLRQAIIAAVGARLPGLRDELEGLLRGQPEARLLQLAGELGTAQDEAQARAILGQHA